MFASSWVLGPTSCWTLPMLQGVRSVCTTLILLLLVTYTFAVAMVQLLQNLGFNDCRDFFCIFWASLQTISTLLLPLIGQLSPQMYILGDWGFVHIGSETPHGMRVLQFFVAHQLWIWQFFSCLLRLLHKFRNKDIGAGKFDNVPTATNFLLMQTLCGSLGCNVDFTRNVDCGMHFKRTWSLVGCKF